MTRKTTDVIADVIIIGGGMAGLAAAHHLTTQEKRRVCLVEARERLGGRIKSIAVDGDEGVDVGAMFIQGLGTPEYPNPLAQFITEYQLKTIPIDDMKAECFDTEARAVEWPKLCESLIPGFEAANMRIQEAKQLVYEHDMPPVLQQVLLYNEKNIPSPDSTAYWVRKLVTASVAQHTGAKLDQISLLECMSERTERRDFGKRRWIVGGMQQLIDILYEKALESKKLQVKLNCAISAVLHDPHEETCTVLTENNEQLKAKAVIVAVPLNVIKSGNIKFIPELSKEKVEAMKHLHVGYHNVVLLQFDKIFWNKEAHFIFPNDKAVQHFPEYINLTALYASSASPNLAPTPLLMANFYADEAHFGKHSDEEILKKALAPLKRVYPNFTYPINHYISHWDTAPHSLGSKCFFAKDAQIHDPDILSAPEAGGVYFASDSAHANGTIEDAYESGLMAGLQIAVYLKHKTHLMKEGLGSSFRPRHGFY